VFDLTVISYPSIEGRHRVDPLTHGLLRQRLLGDRQALLIVGLLVAAFPSFAQQQKVGAPPEASNMRLVGWTDLPHTGGGYCHELIEVTECVAAGRRESAVMPLADTVAVQEVMGTVMDTLGAKVQEGPATL